MRVLAIVHPSGAGPGVFVDPIRASGAELHCWRLSDEGPPWCDPLDYDAVLTLGGATHPDDEDRHPWLAEEKALLADLLGRRVPLLAVGLGAQLLCEAAGAPPRRAGEPELGWHSVELTQAASRDPVLGPLAPRFDALQWHSYELRLPPGATALARSASCLQAFEVADAAWGIQFRAEVTLEQVESWLDDRRSNDDALAPDLTAYELRSDTRWRIAAWNELGRGVCQRFLEEAKASRRRRPRLRVHRR